MAGGRVFINYRRDDSRADSGRVYDRLAACFPGRVFRDIVSLEPGVEWGTAIARVLGQTHACIIVIGKTWLNITDSAGRRRLDDSSDTVRHEILLAIQRQMRIFPVLVGGAQMPSADDLPPELRPLCRFHAIELNEQDWDEDVRKLIKALEPVLGPARDLDAHHRPLYRRASVLVGCGLLAAVAMAVYAPNILHRDSKTLEQNGSAAPKQASVIPGVHEPLPQDHSVSPPSTQPAYPDVAEVPGAWRARVSQMPDQIVEVFPDHSFRVLLQQKTSGVGRWRYESGVLHLGDATNFLSGLKFECLWNALGGGFSGGCRDAAQYTWSVSMTREGDVSADDAFDIPRVDVSSLTTGERAAFAEYLAGQRCTCNCGLTILSCLRKDLTCNISPNLARIALATFLHLTR